MEPCTQEVKIALLERQTQNAVESLRDIRADIREIKISLLGNGGKGMKTQIELNAQGIARSWWWLGALSMAVLAFIVKAFV